jgi:hypothetical protein
MSDSGNGVATSDRATRLQDYVYFDALSLFISNLGTGGTCVLDDVVPQKYTGADEFVSISSPPLRELWPDGADDKSDEFNRTDALATIVTGEIFLTLAASGDVLSAEGRRLIGLGRERLAKIAAEGSEAP